MNHRRNRKRKARPIRKSAGKRKRTHPGGRSLAKSPGGSPPAIALTGERNGDRYLIRISGKPVYLASGLFRLFCVLVDARLFGDSPERQVKKWKVRRIRKAIDRQTGRARTGEAVLALASKGHYAVATPPDDISVEVSFRNVLLTNGVEKSVADRLISRSRIDVNS